MEGRPEEVEDPRAKGSRGVQGDVEGGSKVTTTRPAGSSLGDGTFGEGAKAQEPIETGGLGNKTGDGGRQIQSSATLLSGGKQGGLDGQRGSGVGETQGGDTGEKTGEGGEGSRIGGRSTAQKGDTAISNRQTRGGGR